MATGCTFGKGNIQKLGYGKFALTLIDNKTRRSVRVVTKPETIQRSKESEFIRYRQQGVPASKIDTSLAEPLIEMMLAAPAEEIFDIGPVTEATLPPARPHDFNTVICAQCGEVVVERYARIRNGQIVCMPCAEKI